MSTFSKEKRLRSKAEYDGVFSGKRKKFVFGPFTLLVTKNRQHNGRLGLAISKKVVARAVGRNRIKRLVRESFREANLKGLDVVILARRGIEQQSNQELFIKLSKAWPKITKSLLN